jgi:GNAT superfamily N-acetyltransferase
VSIAVSPLTFSLVLKKVYPNLKLCLLEIPDIKCCGSVYKALELESIILPVLFRNLGLGSKIMRSIVEYADQHTYLILLNPSDAFGSDLKRLTQFYSRFGFQPSDPKLIKASYRMYRLPNI